MTASPRSPTVEDVIGILELADPRVAVHQFQLTQPYVDIILAALRAQPAAEAVPVAWMYPQFSVEPDGSMCDQEPGFSAGPDASEYVKKHGCPLYTTPPTAPTADRDSVIEECARVCDAAMVEATMSKYSKSADCALVRSTANDCANKVRALKNPGREGAI